MGEKRDPMGKIRGHFKGVAPNLSEILTRRQRLRKQQAKPSVLGPSFEADSFEKRKLETGRYELQGRGLLVRTKPYSLVGSKARDEEVVPYAPTVRI